MKLTAVAAAAAFMITAGSVWAQAAGEASAMPECTGPCTYSNQTIGDTITPVDSSSSYSNQVNPSSSSNASGVDIGADQRLQQSGNTVDQSGNSLSTGPSSASSTGNRSDLSADTYSNASNGNMTGLGGSAVTGDSKAQIGDTNADSRADSRVDNHNAVAGGAGGRGGDGGKATAGVRDAGNASQGQQMGQGQSSAVDSSQSADVRSGSVSGVRDSGSSAVDVDASDNSTHSTEIDASVRYYPPVIPSNPVQLAAGNLMVTGSGCGPIVNKTREEVVGTFHGLLGVNHVDLGWDEDIVDAVDPATGQLGYYARVTLRNGDVQLIGSQVTTTHALIGVGGGRNLSLFGAGSSGGAGQVGAGGNSSMQRVVLRHTVRACDAGTWKRELPVVEQVRQ